jgi:hypothetical protein
MKVFVTENLWREQTQIALRQKEAKAWPANAEDSGRRLLEHWDLSGTLHAVLSRIISYLADKKWAIGSITLGRNRQLMGSVSENITKDAPSCVGEVVLSVQFSED